MSYEDIDAFKGNPDNQENTGFDLTKSKEFYAELCKSLTVPTKTFEPIGIVDKITEFINRPGINRMIYSEISNYMFNLETYKLNSVLINVEKLLNYVLENKDKSIPLDCTKIVIKIYDHCNLISSQTDNARQIIRKGNERVKEDLERSLKENFKSLEREYITILGIFVAIILAFVGGITFSSSVLQHMGSVSSYRLFGVIIAIGTVLLNALFLMMKFICSLNGIKFKKKWIFWIDGIALALFCVVMAMRHYQW